MTLSLSTREESRYTLATAPTLQAEASACRSPHLLLHGPWGLLVIVFSCGSEALGLASEFSEEPLSTTEVLLINATSDSGSLESPAVLGATCCNPAGGRCLASPPLVPTGS